MGFLPFLIGKYSKLLLTILLALFFSSALLYSQIKIKEKVIINPTQPNLNLRTELSTLSVHSIRVQVSMSSNEFCYYVWWNNQTYCGLATGTARITPPGSTGGVTFTGSGGEATFGLEGTYYYSMYWALPNGVAACGEGANIKVYLDNTLIESRSIDNACSTWGQFTVTFPQCGPECSSSSPPVAPSFTVNASYKNGDYGFNGCNDSRHPFGYFYPYILDKDAGNMFEDFSLDVCFNTSTQKWQASVAGNNIKIRAILDLCVDNMNSNNRKVLESLNDVNETNIPKDRACEAFIDFFNHGYYPFGGSFVIKEFIEKHEQTHFDEFKNTSLPNSLNGIGANGGSFPKYPDFINLFGPECSEQNNYDDIKSRAKNYFNEANIILRNTLLTHYKKSYSIDNESNINTSSHQRIIIRKYQDKLIELYPEIKNSPCYDYLIWE